LSKQLQDHRVDLRVHRGAEPVITWDLQKATQVFFNLLQNAVHAVQEKVKPTVNVGFAMAGDAELAALEPRPSRALAVTISDNGDGIPTEFLGRIFDPFFTTKDIGTGTGLGLSVVYGLMREVNGKVLVDTMEGLGTTFTLLFPLPPVNA